MDFFNGLAKHSKLVAELVLSYTTIVGVLETLSSPSTPEVVKKEGTVLISDHIIPVFLVDYITVTRSLANLLYTLGTIGDEETVEKVTLDIVSMIGNLTEAVTGFSRGEITLKELDAKFINEITMVNKRIKT